MAEEQPPRSPGNTAVDLVGGIMGLVVFLGGVALLLFVFVQATRLYGEIGPAIDAARVGSAEVAPAPTKAPTGPVIARPGGKPLAKVAAEFGLKFLWLAGQGFLAALMAAMGAKLAGAHRGKRT